MSLDSNFGGPVVWEPGPDYTARAHLTQFMRQHDLSDFSALMERSTRDVGWFTQAVLDYLDIRFRQPYSQVVDLSEGIAWPRWCVGGRMNIIHNCLDKYEGTETESQAALIWEGEGGQVRSLTYGELRMQVNLAAGGLRSLGLGPGDAIGLYMPMVPEIVVALLAIAKIGGVILPLFSGYGAGAVASRLVDGGARALITADGYARRGSTIEMMSVADQAARACPSLEHVVIYAHAGLPIEMLEGRDLTWDSLLAGQLTEAETEDTEAEAPLMVIYTSGTTGKPKGAVHTHCGFPVKAAQDMAFGMDVHPGDRIYWMTDMGWMMGPWLVFGALLLGGTFFIFDGAPDFPGPGRVWDLVERHKITSLGISPTLVRALIPHGDEPFRSHDLSTLRFFGSTGEPWNPDPWMWLFQKVGGGSRPIINYSGGTEISGGILMGNPVLPLKPTAFSGPCPGIAADVFDEQGHSVINQVGELVIKSPWIGMTRGFWKDPGRYLETYWSRWPNVWVHGDFAAVDSDGSWYILGRSDDTIKVGGKRLGPAEVESILVDHPAVMEAAAIGVPHEVKGSQLIAFCVLSPDVTPSNELAGELREKAAKELGKPLAPSRVRFVGDLPKTRNAKVMRRMIRAAYLGQDYGDTSALMNPEALDEFAASKDS
ncbi:MAG: AMP-binding protein [Anaerolineae bacterium]|nr:MAG: AMP-binding protein [Anaerolineae bacterium]